jgi:hypothetical protein
LPDAKDGQALQRLRISLSPGTTEGHLFDYVDVPVVNIEYSLGREQTNMAAKIFEKLPLT